MGNGGCDDEVIEPYEGFFRDWDQFVRGGHSKYLKGCPPNGLLGGQLGKELGSS